MPDLQQLPMPGALLLCIAIAALLVYVPFFAVGYGRFQVGYDRSAPRSMLEQLPPFAKRATWAHQNAFEAFIFFASAALMAYVTGQDSVLALGAAIAYIIARLLYPIFYILDIPSLRSLMFGIGSLGTILLFVLSCRSALM